MDDGSQPMDAATLAFLESPTILQPMGLLFVPFETKVVYFDDLDALLSTHAVGRHPTYTFDWCDKALGGFVDIYTGDVGWCELDNMRCFVNHHQESSVNIGFYFNVAIAVGRSPVGDVVMDIPYSAFPWPCKYFVTTDAMDFWSTRPSDGLVNPHTLRATCDPCRVARKACTSTQIECDLCLRRGIRCVPNAKEGEKRRRAMYHHMKSKMGVLSAIYQYTADMFLRRATGYGRKQVEMAALGRHLTANLQPLKNFRGEFEFKTRVDAFQEVSVVNGTLKIVSERNCASLWAFEGEKFKQKSDRQSVIFPHLGMHHPEDAYSLIDTALRFPGEIFWQDMCILDRSFVPISRRVMAIGSVTDKDHIGIILGWMSP